jgi:hypothetical protein
MKVFKYQLSDVDPEAEMPRGARVLHVGEQYGRLYLWALVDPTQPLQRRQFVVRGTGGDVPDGLTYLGTAFFGHGAIVLHVFEAR